MANGNGDYVDEVFFESDLGVTTMSEGEEPLPTVANPYPDPILKLSEDQMNGLTAWVTQWLLTLKSAHDEKMEEWVMQEIDYRARSLGPQNTPFVGACGDVVPVMAMAVDPVHARLDTGIFKADPVFRLKALKKSFLPRIQALEMWIHHYQKHKLQLRSIASPRLLELTKHGTCIFKTVYDREKYKVKTYDKEWKVTDKEVTRFSGPRVFGISIADFLFPPWYQHLQDCPFVAERQRLTYNQLRIAEESGKLANCKKVKGQESNQWTSLDEIRMEASEHVDNNLQRHHIEVWEIWCDYDIDNDGLPERLVLTYHEPSGTFLQLRYNWYFHQRKPYTVIPYSVVNNSLYGIGIGEMTNFFQRAQTDWHRHATNNAYLANIRMFVAKKESGIEEVPKLYTGKVFFVDNPKEDFIPFAAAEIYNSTLNERQNLFGLAEKRTGVSDYLTGRESPVVGSRATATSTVALIQEGTRRVEEVLENIRAGMAEVIQNCLAIWIQYGLDGLDDIIFGDDQIGDQLKAFFDEVDADNVEGSIAIDLSATDAANNRAVQQQVQLAVIQVMMQYLNKLVEAGQLAISAQQTQPVLSQMIGEVMRAARELFKDLLQKYDIPNPDDYLPDLEKFLNAATQGQGVPGESPAGPDLAQGLGGMEGGVATTPSAVPPVPEMPGRGASIAQNLQAAGGGYGIP